MPSFAITDFQTTGQTLAGFDDGLITQTGTLSVFSGRGISATNSGTAIMKVDVFGLLRTAGNGSAATKAIEFDGADMNVLVGRTGSIVANGSSGIGIDADFDERFGFTNQGTIDTDGKTFAFEHADTSSDLEFINTGTITSRDVIIDLIFSRDDTSILNSGTMISEGVLIDFDLALSSSSFDLTNTGDMISGSNGIDLTSMTGFVDISNAGFISGIEAIANATSLLFANDTFLVNSGTIQGETKAYDGSSGLDEIINSGLMVGRIELAADDDIYKGKNGRVDGDVFGGDGNDVLIGGSEDNYVDGGNDNDVVRGNGGNDELFGAAGDDTVQGGEGQDQVFGGDGFDTLSGGDGADTMDGGIDDDILKGGGGGDDITGGDGEDTMHGGDGHDMMYGGGNRDDMFGGNGNDAMYGGSSADMMRGGQGDDTLDGGTGLDVMHAGAGDDMLIGGNNPDEMRGGAGSDELFGGAGGDTLSGGRDDDVLTGGGSADIFVFNRNAGDDVITDFTNGSDQIDLSAFGLQPADYAGVVAPAISNAGGGASFIDLAQLGGQGSILIEGLAFGSVNSADFIL